MNKTSFAFAAIFLLMGSDAANAAANIYFGTYGIALETSKRAAHALHFQINGTPYFADAEEGITPGRPTLRLRTPDGRNYSIRPFIEGTIIYEPPNNTQTTNSCLADATILEPGNYVFLIRCGRGGDGVDYPNRGAAAGFDAIEQRFDVTLTEYRMAYIFRGGNGNPGGTGIGQGPTSPAAGGGASGAPSAIITCPFDPQNPHTYTGCDASNSQIYISQGGSGGRGAGASNQHGQFLYGRGAGGGFGPFHNGENGTAVFAGQNSNDNFVVGGGGGGAPGGSGGAGFVAVAGQWFAEPGFDAIGNASGAGGRACSFQGNSTQCGMGGVAGAGTVSWTCGGHALYSFGGGSGGGLATRTHRADGGHGGSGAGTQITHSYVRIYKVAP